MLFLPRLPNILRRNQPDCIDFDICALLSLKSVAIFLARPILILAVRHAMINNWRSNFSSWKFSYLFLILFLSFFLLQVLICLNSVFVYNTVTLPSGNFNLSSLIFSKIVKTNMDSALSAYIPLICFNCLTSSIYWNAFGSVSNSFCLLTPIAIEIIII